MEVYVDVIILENFIVNLFLLSIVSRCLNIKRKEKNIYLAALLGGVYTMVMFTEFKLLYSLPVKILIVFGMLKIGLNIHGFSKTLKSIILYFLTSFMLSGVCFAISLYQIEYKIGQAFSIENYSIKFIIISIMILYMVLIRISDYAKERNILKNLMYDIYINNKGKQICLKGFLDTGNELKEPISNLPCIIASNKYLNQFDLEKSDSYIVSYSTIGDCGNLKGFKFDEVRIKNELDNQWRNIEVIICMIDKELSKENEYQVLLSRGVI